MSIYRETLSPEQLKELKDIQSKAKAKHDKAYKAAKARGRDYPLLPYECSWAYEMEFRRSKNNGN